MAICECINNTQFSVWQKCFLMPMRSMSKIFKASFSTAIIAWMESQNILYLDAGVFFPVCFFTDYQDYCRNTSQTCYCRMSGACAIVFSCGCCRRVGQQFGIVLLTVCQPSNLVFFVSGITPLSITHRIRYYLHKVTQMVQLWKGWE